MLVLQMLKDFMVTFFIIFLAQIKLKKSFFAMASFLKDDIPCLSVDSYAGFTLKVADKGK